VNRARAEAIVDDRPELTLRDEDREAIADELAEVLIAALKREAE